MDYSQAPLGFGMALARNPVALNTYSAMTQEQQQAILTQAKQAQSGQEMSQIVNALAAGRTH